MSLNDGHTQSILFLVYLLNLFTYKNVSLEAFFCIFKLILIIIFLYTNAYSSLFEVCASL